MDNINLALGILCRVGTFLCPRGFWCDGYSVVLRYMIDTVCVDTKTCPPLTATDRKRIAHEN